MFCHLVSYFHVHLLERSYGKEPRLLLEQLSKMLIDIFRRKKKNLHSLVYVKYFSLNAECCKNKFEFEKNYAVDVL